MLVDEVVSYEDTTRELHKNDETIKIVSSEQCLSILCKMLDLFATGPRTLMVVSSLRVLHDKSGSHRPLEWAKLGLLGEVRQDGSVDYTQIYRKILADAEMDDPRGHVKRLVYALNGHARPLAFLNEKLRCKAQSVTYTEWGFTDVIRSVFPYAFPSLPSSTMEELLLAVFGGREFDSDATVGDGEDAPTAGALQQKLYLLSSATHTGHVECVLSPSYLASLEGNVGIEFRLRELMTVVAFAVNWEHFEDVVFNLVAARTLIHSFSADPYHRKHSAAFPLNDVSIVDHYSVGQRDGGSVFVPPHTVCAKAFKVLRKEKMVVEPLGTFETFSVDVLKAKCIRDDTTYILTFNRKNQQGLDMVVATTTTWYGIQVAHTTTDKTYLDPKSKIVPACQFYETINDPKRQRGPLVFVTNRPFGKHFDASTMEIEVGHFRQFLAADHDSCTFSSVFIVRDHIHKLLTKSFRLATDDTDVAPDA